MAFKAWRSIAAELGLSEHAVMQRGVRDLGLPIEVTRASDRPLTPHQEKVLRLLRAERYPWTAIAGAMGMKVWLVRQHGRNLGLADDNVKHDRVKPEEAPPALPEGRGPLPPGHPLTWASITAGTCLEGTPYPAHEVRKYG